LQLASKEGKEESKTDIYHRSSACSLLHRKGKKKAKPILELPLLLFLLLLLLLLLQL
jgi:hypothetical protein